jgi:hypothetical protein
MLALDYCCREYYDGNCIFEIAADVLFLSARFFPPRDDR